MYTKSKSLFCLLVVILGSYSHKVMAQNDTLNKPYFDSLSYRLYTSPGGGFASGNNAYNDKAKVQTFNAHNFCNIYTVLIHFGYKSFNSLNDSSYVHINYYSIDGVGKSTVSNAAACANTIFFTDSIKVADIDTVNGNVLSYSNSIYTDSAFAIGIDFKSLHPLDTVALYTNKDGDAGNREEAWEQAQNGLWFTLKYNWPLSVDYAIFPVVNTAVGLQVLSANKKELILYPNPSQTGEITVHIAATQLQSVQVFNANMQVVPFTYAVAGNEHTRIVLPSNAKGLYFIHLNTQQGTFLQKFVLQ